MQKKLILRKKKITFKVVRMKFFAMHITNQKFCFYIFTIRNLLNIVMEHYPYVMIKNIKIYNFDPYTVLLAIATYDWFCGHIL